MAYFQRTGATTFRPTEHTSGAWRADEQHIGPALGLLAHAIEQDLEHRRGTDLVVARLGYDILGTLPVEEVSVAVEVLRPGRTIELVEARLGHGGRDAVRMRAWLLRPEDSAGVAGTAFEPIPPRAHLPTWHPTDLWPGGFLASAEVRRGLLGPGRAAVWVRPLQPLLSDEPTSALARCAGVLDIANGMATRADPQEWTYPNVDLTAHLFRSARLLGPGESEWVGFDITVSFGPGGVGLTSSVLHDDEGAFGVVNQILTLRPRTPSSARASHVAAAE